MCWNTILPDRVKIQHYVPQLLLRWHATEPGSRRGSEQVWCFDKHTDRVFSPNIRGVTAESGYYEISTEDCTFSLESALSKLEGEAAPLVGRLIETRNLQSLRSADRTTMASFVAVQFTRTPSMREMIEASQRTLIEALERRGIGTALVPQAAPMCNEGVRAISLDLLSTSAQEITPHLVAKHWFLVAGDTADPFHIGDNPVVLDNSTHGSGSGNLGIASPGVEIYLPLSPTLCLGMTDRRIADDLSIKRRQSMRLAQRRRKRASRIARQHGNQAIPQEFKDAEMLGAAAEDQVSAFLFGRATPYDARVVTRINSLQMMYATRWVISSKNDFSLPRRMLLENGSFRRSMAAQTCWH